PKRKGKRIFASEKAVRQFKQQQAMLALESVEAALRLLTGQNRDLIRIIQAGKFNSMAELAAQSGRAESNLNRTIKKLSNLGLVRLKRERGRLVKPELAIRSLRVELAARIAKLLGHSPESWLRMQEALDLWRLAQDPSRLAGVEPLPRGRIAA